MSSSILYTQHEKLIKERARAYSNFYKTDYSDALSDASELFCEVAERYDPDIGKFSTLLYNNLRSLTYNMKKQKMIDEVTDYYDHCENAEGAIVSTEETYSFEIYESAEKCLSEDGMEVLELLFSGEIGGDKDINSIRKYTIFSHLRQKKWETYRIKEVLSELERWYKKEIAV